MGLTLAISLAGVALLVGVGPLALGMTGFDRVGVLYALVRHGLWVWALLSLGSFLTATRITMRSTKLRGRAFGVWAAFLVTLLAYPLPRALMWSQGLYPMTDPRVVNAEEADRLLEDDELVMGVVLEGEPRAYPLRYLVTHEVVNDRLAETPLVATY